jgi:hypothetical protein
LVPLHAVGRATPVSPQSARGRIKKGRLTDGKVSKIDILRSDHPVFAKEAQRLFKGMRKWMPAHTGEKPVAVSYVYPLTFKLE